MNNWYKQRAAEAIEAEKVAIQLNDTEQAKYWRNEYENYVRMSNELK